MRMRAEKVGGRSWKVGYDCGMCGHFVLVLALLVLSCGKDSGEEVKREPTNKHGQFFCYTFSHEGEDRSYCRASEAECEYNRSKIAKIAAVAADCRPSATMWCFGNSSFSECTQAEQECQRARKRRALGLLEPLSSYSECESASAS